MEPHKHRKLWHLANIAMVPLLMMLWAFPSRADYGAIRTLDDISYGKYSDQTLDVYLPAKPNKSPVILMIHGGTWRWGDKRSRAVVKNKVDRWVARGFIFISVNYRLLPGADPLIQAQDVARAIAVAQEITPSLGGDASRFIVMGHSSGAHLAALLAAAPQIAQKQGAKNWLGTVLIDTAALDLVKLMKHRHLPLYDRAFGRDIAYWRSVSPWHRLTTGISPILAICSRQRGNSCGQARRFKKKAQQLSSRVDILPIAMRHMALNRKLGVSGHYTKKVEEFLASLDHHIAGLLRTH